MSGVENGRDESTYKGKHLVHWIVAYGATRLEKFNLERMRK